MDLPRFVNHYSSLIGAMRISGLATPWMEKPSSLLPRLPYLIWDTLLGAILVYMLLIYVHTLISIHISFQDFCGIGISSPVYICGLLLIFYYINYGRDLKGVTDHMDRISTSIQGSILGHVEVHQQMYIANGKYIKLLIIIFFRISSVFTLLYCLVVPVTDFMAGEYRSKFPVMINSPFNDRLPGVYELTFGVMSCCVVSSYTKKAVTDCLFIALLSIQTDFLKYLSITMTGIEKEFSSGNSELARKKLTVWIELHQEVIKNIQDLVLLFSPVIILYYVSVIGNIVCAAFILAKKDNESFFQSILMAIYTVMAPAYLYLLSSTAQQLTTEANNLADMAYSTPWYDMKKSDADIIRLVVQIANRPLLVTAFRAPVFLLNRETFANFMARAVSAFITLCRLKDSYDESNFKTSSNSHNIIF